MAKLYPPYIEGTIPAFYKTVDLDGTVRAALTVPFSMNKAVSKWEVEGFSLKLKNVFGDDTYLISMTTDYHPFLDNDRKVTFNLTEEMLTKLTIGQFYKVQIAYISNDSIGYYSTVGIVKYTTHPNIEMPGLSPDVINMHRYSYIGKYSQVAYGYQEVNVSRQYYKPNLYYKKDEELDEYYLAIDEKYDPPYYTKAPLLDIDNMKDATEKAYNYRFILTDFKGNIVSDSGYLLHNSSEDINSYESQDTFAFPSDLQNGKIYYIQYSVITNNNMEVFSPKYRIMQKRSLNPEIYATVNAEMDYDNGFVNIKLVGELDDDGMERGATGSFLLTRSCSDDNFTVWNEILRFGLHGQKPSRELYRDFTTEQGKSYIYSLQQYNDSGLYSARIKSNQIYSDFEDAFLFDGKRQLKIKYNPKISSFKNGLLESKINTIGGQFPFIFRNGNVSYKEFPLSGLISYQSDEKNLFMSDEELGLESKISGKRPGTFRDDIEATDRYFEDLFNLAAGGPSETSTFDVIKNNYNNRKQLKENINDLHSRTTSLVSYNILAERKFKLEVLDWLNDGKVKLFRSPTEGNYLIKLINVSLTPEEKTGRMLHTFNATACEIAEYNYDNMNKYGIISISDPQYKTLRFESIRLAEYEDKAYDSRYEAAFSYQLLNTMNEIRFNQLTEAAIEEAMLPFYYKALNGRYIQLKAKDPYNINILPYYEKNSYGSFVEASYINQEVYETEAERVLNNIFLDFYKRSTNILLQDVYTQVNANDTFDLEAEYYIRKTTGHLYYVKPGTNLLEAREVTSLRLTDMTPGDTFYLQLETWGKPELFTIGATGAYLVDTDINIIYFGLPNDMRYTGTLTYSYYEDTSNLFNEVEGLEITPVVSHQFIGDQGNIIAKIENIRDTISDFYYINVYKRSIGTAHYNPKDGNLYRWSQNGKFLNLIGVSIPPHTGKEENSIPIGDEYFEDPFMLYHYTRDEYLNASAWTIDKKDPNIKIYNPFNFYYDPWNPKQIIVSQETYDRIKDQNVSISGLLIYSNKIYFNNNEMSIEETQRYYADSEEFVFKNITCSVGTAIEIGYELQSINYSIIRQDPIVAKYYEIYLEEKQFLEKAKTIQNPTDEQIDKLIEVRNKITKSYNDFIAVLTEALRVWEAEQKL